MEAGGVEPQSKEKMQSTSCEQKPANSGQTQLQTSQIQEDTKICVYDYRTQPALSSTPAGHAKNIISTEREHNRNIMKTEFYTDLPPELIEVIKAWKHLPDPIKQGILAMINATK